MKELEARTGQPARLIRYLISAQVVPPPVGSTRAASYEERHVEALLGYARLKARGITSLEVIRAELAPLEWIEAQLGAEVPRPEVVILRPIPGVEVRIDPGAMEELDLDDLVERIRVELAAAMRNGGNGE